VIVSYCEQLCNKYELEPFTQGLNVFAELVKIVYCIALLRIAEHRWRENINKKSVCYVLSLGYYNWYVKFEHC
jgi:hypothetical protein